MGRTDSGQGASSGDPEAFTGQEPAGRSSPAAAGARSTDTAANGTGG